MAFESTYLGDKKILEQGLVSQFQKIKLFKNNFTPTKASVEGDFDEADFDDYNAVDLEYSAAFLNATPRAQINADSVTWVKGAGATTNDVYGIYVTDNDGNVMGYELFPAPVSMAIEGVDSVFYQFSPTLDNA